MSRVQGEIDAAVARGNEQNRVTIEAETKMSQGQTPSVDTEKYNAQELKQKGYPLANPTAMPNSSTKEGTRYYANRDSNDKMPIRPITVQPHLLERLPQTNVFMGRSEEMFAGLESAVSDVDVEMGLTNLYKQFIDYTNSLVDDDPAIARDQANRLRYNTIDRLESTGFDHLQKSEYTDEGIDDTGMNGLQMIFAAGIFAGKDYSQIVGDVGETGANDAQLEEAFDRATQGNERAQFNVINGLPATNEEAMQDPRYVGAVTQILQFEKRFEGKNLSELTPKQILSEGKMLADFAKGNLLVLPAILDTIKKNPNSPVAEAWTFILQTDENLPFELADVGRFTAAMATDPTTYLGGYGIWSKFLSKKGAKGVLGKMGIASSFGAGMGAGYGSLYDLGMQNIEIAASGGQKEFDPARLGAMAGVGAGLGFTLGGVVGLAPAAINAASKWIQRFKKPVSAADEFADVPIPDNMIGPEELEGRRLERMFLENKKKTEKMIFDKEWEAEEAGQDALASMIEDFSEMGGTATEIVEQMTKIAKSLADSEVFGPQTIEHLKADKVFRLLQDKKDDIIDIVQRRKLSVIEGGATKADPEHAAPMELIEGGPDKVTGRPPDITVELEAKLQARVDKGEFRFKPGEIVTRKDTGEKFEVMRYVGKEGAPKGIGPEYFVKEVKGGEWTRTAIPESDLVGGKPKMELVNGVPLEDFPE